MKKYVPAPKGYPTKIRIAGQTWRIRYRPGLVDKESCAGSTDPLKYLIEIDADLAPVFMRQVVMHEIIHACMSVNDVHGLNHDQEEAVVRALTLPLISALQTNPAWW